jgi:surface polysaccharide O-acyltransferase-like enzyme
MGRTGEGRVAYADLLRVLATAAVVVLHVSGGWLGQTAVGSGDWTVLVAYDSLAHWCVPMFVMLSGAFLLDPKKSVRLRDIFFKYILRVLAALLVWGVFYAILDYGLVDGRPTWEGVKSALGYVLRADTHYHLWFLYMILGLYLVTPILRAFVRGASRGDLHWFFALTFVFYSLLPSLQWLWPERMTLPMAWADKLDIRLVLGYVGYYVAGYYLRNYTLGRVAEFCTYILGVLGAVVTVGGTIALSVARGGFCDALLEYRCPNIAAMAVAVFVLFRYVLGVSEERSRRQRLGGVAKITFGVYLVHEFFLMLLRHFGVTTLPFNPILSVPVLSAGVLVCSLAVAWLLSKIPLLGRYLT